MQHDFILLDRSGSMETLWKEALGSVNAYVGKLAEDKVDTGVTLAVFDNTSFDVVRDRITPSTWHTVTDKDAMPRGGTPLNDAIGKIVALADKGQPAGKAYDKVAIIIMTDGQENASHELTTHTAKALLDRCRAKGWVVVFLGASFDNAAQAGSYNNNVNATMSAGVGTMAAHTHAIAGKRAFYGTAGATADSMTFTAEEKTSLNNPHSHTSTATPKTP